MKLETLRAFADVFGLSVGFISIKKSKDVILLTLKNTGEPASGVRRSYSGTDAFLY